MNFRTEIVPSVSEKKITHNTPVLSLGSCFADNIGAELTGNKFNACINPFGVIYNPHSLFKALHFVINRTFPDPSTFVKNQGIFYTYDFHSAVSATDQNSLKDRIREKIHETHEFMQQTQWLILTFGTSIVYKRADNDEIVGNCHKIPDKFFNKELLTQKQVLKEFELLYKQLPSDLNIIITVSPVRHLKETLELNSVSKSILRIFCHTIASNYPNIHYFPAYELLLDDLRDYRFYNDDLLHPNPMAKEYIWQKFTHTYFDEPTIKFLKKWKKIRSALLHRPFHPDTEEHIKFLNATLNKLREFQKTIDVSKEIKELESRINGS